MQHLFVYMYPQISILDITAASFKKFGNRGVIMFIT
jgi:hypothetical protein